MAVIGKKRAGGITYYAVFSWQGKRVWERSGSDRREAARLEARRRREVATGTYQPSPMSGATTVGQFAREWLDGRTNRTADKDRGRLEDYVLPKRWFAELPIVDVRPRHIIELIAELKKTIGVRTGAPLSPKSVANTYTALRTMFRDARIRELVAVDPCVVPRGTIRHRTVKKVGMYERGEAAALVRDERVEPNKRVLVALLVLTGMRTGEAAGRRWGDWLRDVKPLGALNVHSQFDDQPLKTGDEVGEQPRVVPVHPELERILDWWWREGWEIFAARKPTSRDFIVPMESDPDSPHTNSSAYRALRTACKRAEVTLRGVHSTRRTFISLARRGGARKDVVERITHNAKGDIVDIYTFWDWRPLCEAVLCVDLYSVASVDANVDAIANPARNPVEPRGIEATVSHAVSGKTGELSGTSPPGGAPKKPGIRSVGAEEAARQHQAALVGLALLRAQETAFDRLWAESLGIDLPAAGGER